MKDTGSGEARRPRIAYFRMGDFPITNQSVEHVLRRSFPDYDIDVIDVVTHIKRKRLVVFLNTLAMLREYGVALLLGYRRPWQCFFSTTYLFKHIKRLAGKVFQARPYVFSFQIQSMFDASLPGIPHFIYTDHTFLVNLRYPHFDGRRLPSPQWLDMEKTMYERADITFVRSTHVERSLHDQYGVSARKTALVYAGSNVNNVENCIKNKDGKKNILFVGIDWERKGGPELLRAFEKVLRIHPDAKLIVVGCDIPCDIANCEFVGRQPPDQLQAFYERATIFCVPTKIEPFGIVFVEALQYALPIVSTTIGALNDIVTPGENGYLVAPGEIEPLADALIRLLNDPKKCAQFGAASRALARDRYNWERVGERMRKRIEVVIAQPPVENKMSYVDAAYGT